MSGTLAVGHSRPKTPECPWMRPSVCAMRNVAVSYVASCGPLEPAFWASEVQRSLLVLLSATVMPRHAGQAQRPPPVMSGRLLQVVGGRE